MSKGDDELACAGIRLLKCLSRLPCRLFYIGMLPCVSEFVRYAASTLYPTADSQVGGKLLPPDHALNSINQCLLFENLGNLSHEMAADEKHTEGRARGHAFVTEVQIKNKNSPFEL